MTIKAKLRLSYFLMIVVSLMLSWSALSSMLKSHDVASYVHTTLVDRYSRSRRAGDLISQIEAQMEKISLGADSRPIVPVIADLSNQLQAAVNEMQESRYPTEVGAQITSWVTCMRRMVSVPPLLTLKWLKTHSQATSSQNSIDNVFGA